MDAGDWIGLAGVVVAVASAGWAVVSARKAQRSEAAATALAITAAQAAADAAAAERRSADAAERSATALERQNQMAGEQVERAEGGPWRLQHQRGDTYQLINATATPKYAVQVAGAAIIRRLDQGRVDGYSSMTFIAISAAGVDETVTVRWHRRADLTDEPPRPPRR